MAAGPSRRSDIRALLRTHDDDGAVRAPGHLGRDGSEKELLEPHAVVSPDDQEVRVERARALEHLIGGVAFHEMASHARGALPPRHSDVKVEIALRLGLQVVRAKAHLGGPAERPRAKYVHEVKFCVGPRPPRHLGRQIDDPAGESRCVDGGQYDRDLLIFN